MNQPKRQLEAKDILPYIPYGLTARLSALGIFNLDLEYPNYPLNKIATITNVCVEYLGSETKISYGSTSEFDFNELEEIEIFLRPLSSLTKEITRNGETFVPSEKLIEIFNIQEKEENTFLDAVKSLSDLYFTKDCTDILRFRDAIKINEILKSWHFDDFENSLIDADLALELKEEK